MLWRPLHIQKTLRNTAVSKSEDKNNNSNNNNSNKKKKKKEVCWWMGEGGDGSFSKQKRELGKISDYWVSKEDADC